MSAITYIILCSVLSILVLIGISFMSKVKTAVLGNLLSAFSLFTGIVITIIYYGIFAVPTLYVFLAIGLILGYILAVRVKMIEMPQMVAIFNGLGGFASGLVGILTLEGIGVSPTEYVTFSNVTATLAIVVGFITLVGSLVAAGKLHKILAQRPVVWKNHQLINFIAIAISLLMVVLSAFVGKDSSVIFSPTFIVIISVLAASLFGLSFSIRVGGADMPITISLLNSLSGVAGAIAGMAIGDILLVAVGGIVGASGLLLTQIMCRAMNRHLIDILMGRTSVSSSDKGKTPKKDPEVKKTETAKADEGKSIEDIIKSAKSVIFVPGYGMALAQAQSHVKQLADRFIINGADVKFAIHPVAGRMPGHMSVLLAEADVPFNKLFEMQKINDDFKNTDLVIVIGANDVLNPAARDAEGTPIYGMPVLNVDHAKNIIICNFDTKPGYSGVDNPLYDNKENVTLFLGDAKESVNKLINIIIGKVDEKTETKVDNEEDKLNEKLKSAKSVIFVPGYGMALAQAQSHVKQLADKFITNGADVKFAIHPVAGRMPGHMSVLLAEADVPFKQLFEMQKINDDFKNTDLVIVIGANDVMNPAAREAEGTPIYGMPVLNVDHAKNIIICNFDTKPGYSGVDNPLYDNKENVTLLLGDAKESVNKLINIISAKSDAKAETKADSKDDKLKDELKSAKSVIFVPGYGMALAQAQSHVKQLADKFIANGADVKFAIHPVAGRMPGHMSVLLAEADVPFKQLFEMQKINDDFKNTDLVIVIGANDVMNPAAREAEGTPIYGMPVLNVDHAKNIIICNFDTKPGYSGVDNPLYDNKENVTLLLGDAKESVSKLINIFNN